jgi:hypothetical protein
MVASPPHSVHLGPQSSTTLRFLSATSAKLILSEEVGRLPSWGDSFEHGELDRTLERDPELKNTALECLSDLGTALADSK